MRNRVFKLFTFLVGKKLMRNFLKSLSKLSRTSASFFHQLQMQYEWTVPPQPEWFDHYCDQFFQFRTTQNPLWLERGIFGLLAINEGAQILELCCGDGFNSYHFYSIRASSIISVDFDSEAISHAKKFNKAKNITFQLCDIRENMPAGKFDNIVWDAAIEHFTEIEIFSIMENIKIRLTEKGILTGYTILEKVSGQKSLSHHEREFKSKEDLLSFFKPFFTNVKVFETIYPTRHNLYFYASNNKLPFDSEWDKISIYNAY